jgi:hypothetical protein
MTAANVDDLLAKLTAQQTALGDGRDARSDNERATWFAAYRAHQEVISTLQNAPDAVGREQRKLDDLEARRAAVVAKETSLQQEIADAPPWREHPDGRERDRRYDHIDQLRRSLERLRAGTLLCAPDRCYEPLSYLDRRIAEVRERRDRAQLALDSCLRQAEQLLAASPVAG